MEEWDILDAKGERTGETVLRSRGALKSGQYHLVAHVWIMDDRRRVLIQQRSYELHILPGKWAITGGSALAGEDAVSAAHRELFEELGINSEPDELKLLTTYKGRNDIVYVYVLNRSIPLSEIKMQYSEVQAVKWVSSGELKKMVEARSFHNYSYLPALYEYIDGNENAFSKK